MGKKKLIILISSIAGFVVLAVAITLILVFTLGGNKTPENPNNNNNGTLLDSARSIKVVQIDGSATVKDDAETINCFKGMNLYDGDSLNVNDDSVVVVKFDADKYVYLGENTKVNIKFAGKDTYKTNIYVEQGTVLAEIQNKLGVDEEFFLSSNNSVMAVRGTIFGVKVVDAGNEFIETYSVYKGVTELFVFDKVDSGIIKGKISDISNSKMEIKVPKEHLLTDDEYDNIVKNWLTDINDKFNDSSDANDHLDEVEITVSKPTRDDYQEVIDILGGISDEPITYSDIEYTSNGFFGSYDGNPHKISIDVKTPNSTVYYKVEGENEYKDINDYEFYVPGIYRVYYKIVSEGFTDKEDFEVVYITNPIVLINTNVISYDAVSQTPILDISNFSNDLFNKYNGVLASKVLENAEFYIGDEKINANSIDVTYKKIIDNYIELVDGTNTLNVKFTFDDFVLNVDVNFLFRDSRDDLGYSIYPSSSNISKLSDNIYFYNISNQSTSINNAELLTSFGIDVLDLESIYINLPYDYYSNEYTDYTQYDGTQTYTINNGFTKINFLVFPTAVSKGFNEVINVYFDDEIPTNYPNYTVGNTNYIYNPLVSNNGVMMDFINITEGVVEYSLDGVDYLNNLYLTESGMFKVYYKITSNSVTIEGNEIVSVTVGESKIVFDNSKFITNPVHIFSDDNNDLTFITIHDETGASNVNVVSSNGNTITSLDDAYLVYSSIIKNSVFYDSVTKEVIDVEVNVSEKKEGSADFNYVVSAEGYENLSGSVKFEYSSIGEMNVAYNIQDDVEVTLPDEYSVSLLEVPTVIPSRPRISLEDSTEITINYQTYYSIDEGKTWFTEAPKINEAGTYNVYTLYCFVDSGNDATALVDGDISIEANSSLAASGNFIINVQTITVE